MLSLIYRDPEKGTLERREIMGKRSASDPKRTIIRRARHFFSFRLVGPTV